MEFEDEKRENDKLSPILLAEGYRQMAADKDREMEAMEWVEQSLFVPD